MADSEKKNGTLTHIKGFPKDIDVTLFQFSISTNRVDYIATNDKIKKNRSNCTRNGLLKICIVKLSSSLVLKNINAENREFNETI